MALRRQRPGTGSIISREGGPTVRWPALATILAGIPWAITGAVATRLYMPERATRDLDILVLAQELGFVEAALRRAGFALVGQLTIGGQSWKAPDGTSVDVIAGEDEWVGQALSEASTNLDPQGAPVLPLPYLVLMKLGASRVQDLADVSRMLGRASIEHLDRVRAVVRSHAPELADDLERLIHLGRLESGELDSSPDPGRL